MRTRSLVLLSLFALVLAACGGSTSESSTTDTAPQTTTVSQPEEVLLSYGLTDGDSYVYDVAIDQDIRLETEGEGSAISEEELPGTADLNVTGNGTFTFDVSDGPDPETYEVTITGDFDDLTVTGTMDGEPVAEEDAPDFAAIEPVSTTVVVDEQGNVIPTDPSVDDPFGGMFGGLESLGGGSVPGAQLGQFFGPPLGDVAVTVGDSWSTTSENPGFGDPITAVSESSVSGTDTINGVEVLVIDTTTTVAPNEFDLGEFFIGMFAGFMPEDPSAEEQAEIDALVEDLKFVISSDEAVSDSTTYFDSEAGITRLFEVSSQANLRFDINIPDDETGDMAGFVMNMRVDQSVTHTLISGPSA